MPKVFVSHSSKDKEYVKLVVSLLNDMGLSSDQIFCSSLPGYDIPLSDKIFDYLRKQFSEFNLHLIILHSKNYYRSAVCLNEMGAAWVHRNRCTSILLPGFDFADMTGVVNDETVAIKLDTDENELKDKLNQLYLELIEEFSLEKKKDILWENKRNAFIEGINLLIAITPDKASTSSPNDRCEEDIEMLESGVYIRKSDLASGKKIYYCPACYTKERKLYPIVQGSMARDKFCSNCRMHYTRL